MNVVLIEGTLSSDVRVKELPSGATVATLEVTTRTLEGSVASVPVDWFVSDPPDWPAGTEVVVLGSVQRRFFRAGAATQSRTSVLAERVASGADRRGAAAVRRRLSRRLAG